MLVLSLCIPYIRRGEDEEPNYTPEEEERLMTKQVKETQGFHMNFRFHCIFNYQPLDLDDNEFSIEPETTRELMNMLSRGSIEEYNVDNVEFNLMLLHLKEHYVYTNTRCPLF
ncbi:hypothetical protein V5N11_009053 [Cardamine amara subsp. amara]|uniref:Uncharacterized protein n=1 Tax=Cardamine amara subsp. amara TaxID=228776 RepID=A0ABD1C810_CARAN